MYKEKLPPLSERMQKAADLVTAGYRVADVGCDHGYIAIWLAGSKKCPICIAMDVGEKPLAAARKNVALYGVADAVLLRRSDGLAALKAGEADCVLIAGMGGTLMARILTEGRAVLETVEELVLEPQSDAAKVRRTVQEVGFRILEEDLVTECGKYYPLIRAVRREQPGVLSETELRYGPCLLRTQNARLKEFLKKEKDRLSAIAENLSRTEGDSARLRAKAVEEELERIREAETFFQTDRKEAMKNRNVSELILASGSPRRKELLERIGITPVVRPSGADETTEESRPDALVLELSRRKCLDVAEGVSDGMVLGADTVVALDGTILGKPADEKEAVQMLRMLSGRKHQVYTGVTLAEKKDGRLTGVKSFAEETAVFVVPLSEEEIAAYVATKEPLDKAGAYGIQGAFAKFIDRLEGDYFNVVGLPLAAVYRELKNFG